MLRHLKLSKEERLKVVLPAVTVALAAALVLFRLAPARGQEPYPFESDLVARHQVFRTVGSGFREIRRGPNGNYYVLTAPGAEVQIYDKSGKNVGQVPSAAAAAAKDAALVYGESFDVDSQGRVIVADRGAKAVKIYSADGNLVTAVPIALPVSVVFLPGDEFAVASPDTEHLVTAYDLSGKLVRDYGDREDIAHRADINMQVNYGHLAVDDAGNNYFSFDFLPEPTVRKFDRLGYLSLEISLKTLEFEPGAQAARKAIARMEDDDRSIPSLHRIISAVGVDPKTEELWIAIGTLLMRFNKDGERIASFRTYLPYGARMEAAQILVEPDRLLIGADPQGIYEFVKPQKLSH